MFYYRLIFPYRKLKINENQILKVFLPIKIFDNGFNVFLAVRVRYLPFGDILIGCVTGAGSIFQGAQHEAGENSGVGPLPADINMVEPPSDWFPPPTACSTNNCHLDTVQNDIQTVLIPVPTMWSSISEAPI